MQFTFDLVDVLGEEAVTMLDGDTRLSYVPDYVAEGDIRKMGKSQKLSYILNEMGKASAKAQGLPRAITTSTKLKHSGHRIYLLKVNDNNDGNYEVVGLLKVGYKTLFLYDIQSQQHEVQPLCVLDFYVHESKQRKGYGRMLFEWMLQAENVPPQHIAIDKPSSKFLLFLAKHYNMTDKVAQLNNFVIFVDFFHGRSDINHRSPNRRRQQYLPPLCVPMHPQLSSSNVSSMKNITLPKRRTQSTVSKDRVQIVTLENLCVNESNDALNVDQSAPPLLQRGSSNIPLQYKACLSSEALHNNKTQSNQSLAAHVIKRPPSERSHNSQQKVQQIKAQQQCCGQIIRKDYNYDVGLARHYSHTRLW